MLSRAKAPGNDYYAALGVVMEYVEPVSEDEPHDLYGPNPNGLDEDCGEVYDDDCDEDYDPDMEMG